MMDLPLQPADFTWPTIPRGMVACIRCSEYFHPDDYKQCPACYLSCARCWALCLIEGLDGSGRCAVCVEEERNE